MLKTKAIYIDEDVRRKYIELNNSGVTDDFQLLIDWISSNITVIGTDTEYQESELSILFKEQEWNNNSSRNKQQRKLDSLLNDNTNFEISNKTNSVNTTQNSKINWTILFVTGRNRRKNKSKETRRKSNWLRLDQLELLEKFSKGKNLILPEDICNPINLTDQQLPDDELNVCNGGLKFISTVKSFHNSLL